MELDLLVWLLAAFFLAAAAFGVGVVAVAAWTASRTLDRLLAAVAPVRTGPPDEIRDVEARLSTLASAPYVDSGVVRSVVPESRRRRGRLFGRLGRTPGVRFDVALPVAEEGATLPVWTPVPDRLTGTTELERVAAACGVAPDRLSDAVGEEVAVRRVDGRWTVGEESQPSVRTASRPEPDRSRTAETDRC